MNKIILIGTTMFSIFMILACVPEHKPLENTSWIVHSADGNPIIGNIEVDFIRDEG